MATLDRRKRGRGQEKPKRSKWKQLLRRPFVLRILFVLAPVLAKIVWLGVELSKNLRE